MQGPNESVTRWDGVTFFLGEEVHDLRYGGYYEIVYIYSDGVMVDSPINNGVRSLNDIEKIDGPEAA